MVVPTFFAKSELVREEIRARTQRFVTKNAGVPTFLGNQTD
ncbi:hypothetical protein LEP1GSC052_2792 [Leptospira kmetyi serovar Malaysia str. Bejo-Iso9]|nr:hypothetical protein LEP1GSC052_2792 [Leptospira kmetyi serovar Malaysia str. Bejo-Iso9]